MGRRYSSRNFRRRAGLGVSGHFAQPEIELTWESLGSLLRDHRILVDADLSDQ